MMLSIAGNVFCIQETNGYQDLFVPFPDVGDWLCQTGVER